MQIPDYGFCVESGIGRMRVGNKFRWIRGYCISIQAQRREETTEESRSLQDTKDNRDGLKEQMFSICCRSTLEAIFVYVEMEPTAQLSSSLLMRLVTSGACDPFTGRWKPRTTLHRRLCPPLAPRDIITRAREATYAVPWSKKNLNNYFIFLCSLQATTGTGSRPIPSQSTY